MMEPWPQSSHSSHSSYRVHAHANETSFTSDAPGLLNIQPVEFQTIICTLQRQFDNQNTFNNSSKHGRCVPVTALNTLESSQLILSVTVCVRRISLSPNGHRSLVSVNITSRVTSHLVTLPPHKSSPVPCLSRVNSN